MTDGHRIDLGQRGFGGRFAGADEPIEPGAPRGLGRYESARYRPDPPVEGQFAEGGVLAQALGWDLTGRCEDCERDRKVESRPLLPEAGRREVDRDALHRPLELGARDAASHPLLRLLAGLVRQTDDGEARDAALQVGLDLDGPCLEAHEGVGRRACEHGSETRRRKRAPFRASRRFSRA
jgi:hypothetical protein